MSEAKVIPMASREPEAVDESFHRHPPFLTTNNWTLFLTKASSVAQTPTAVRSPAYYLFFRNFQTVASGPSNTNSLA